VLKLLERREAGIGGSIYVFAVMNTKHGNLLESAYAMDLRGTVFSRPSSSLRTHRRRAI
jgi:hypothetical protein